MLNHGVADKEKGEKVLVDSDLELHYDSDMDINAGPLEVEIEVQDDQSIKRKIT